MIGKNEYWMEEWGDGCVMEGWMWDGCVMEGWMSDGGMEGGKSPEGGDGTCYYSQHIFPGVKVPD